jgi:hypothetical protein
MADQSDQQDHHHRDPHAGEGNSASLLNAAHCCPQLLLAQPNALLRPSLSHGLVRCLRQ